MNKLLPLILLSCAALFAQAQTADPSKVGSDFRIPFYRATPDGKILEARCTGKSAERVGGGDFLVASFEMKNFRNGDENQVQFIAQAPQCQINVNTQTAFSPGHLEIFTPTTNLFIQGEGFFCVQSNRLLIISNNVETRVERELVRSNALASASSAPSDQPIKIFAGHFQLDYESQLVHYSEKVRVLDRQTEITCDHLSVQFTTNGVMEWILAEQDVVITMAGRGKTTSERAYDFVTNGVEIIELTGHPFWHDGDQEAKADKFVYDKGRNLLTATGQVQSKFPNHGTNTAAGFSEMFADFATIQMPPDRGPVQSMIARGGVIITNHLDQSTALAQQAEFTHDTDTLLLTGDPVWRDHQMEVRGETLSMIQGQASYSAHGGAQLKLKIAAGKGTGFAGISSSSSSNQWLVVTSRLLDYRDNLATFDHDVVAKLLEGDALQGKLLCDLLTVRFAASNQIEKIVAHDSVHLERAPDNIWAKKTLDCKVLTVDRTPATGLLRSAVAEGSVFAVQMPAPAGLAHANMAADRATVVFSQSTNQVDRIVAENNVSGEKVEVTGKANTFTGNMAVYHLLPEPLLDITGNVLAKVISPSTNTASHKYSEWIVTDATSVTWDPKKREFAAKGHYRSKSIPASP